METPYLKQSKRGQFSYRRAVPDPLRAAVGKREIKISLKTADTKTARVRWAQAHSEAEQILAAAKSGANLSEDILFNQSVQKLARHRLSLKKPSEWSNEERDNRSALQDILLDEAGFTSVDEFSEAFDGSLEHKRLAMDLGVASGTVITPPLTLSVIFKEWLRDKARKKDTDSQGWKKYKTPLRFGGVARPTTALMVTTDWKPTSDTVRSTAKRQAASSSQSNSS